jgi:hypothetical protein
MQIQSIPSPAGGRGQVLLHYLRIMRGGMPHSGRGEESERFYCLSSFLAKRLPERHPGGQ